MFPLIEILVTERARYFWLLPLLGPGAIYATEGRIPHENKTSRQPSDSKRQSRLKHAVHDIAA